MDARNHSEKLREITKQRMAAGEFNAVALAKHCASSPAHISNVLKGKRQFTLKLFFQFLKYLRLPVSALDLPIATSRQKGAGNTKEKAPDLIPIVSQVHAVQAALIEPYMQLKRKQVIRLATPEGGSPAPEARLAWTRFVAVRPTRAQIEFLKQPMDENSLIVIDRHDLEVDLQNTDRNYLFAIRRAHFMSIGHLQEVDGQIMLLSTSDTGVPRIVRLTPPQRATHQIVGRVKGIWYASPLPSARGSR